MENIIFWTAFVIYTIVTIRRAYNDRKLVMSAVTVLVMLALIGWQVFVVPSVSIVVK